MGFFGPNREEREALQLIAAERWRREKEKWVGRTMIASQTTEVKFITNGVGTVRWREAEVLRAEPVSGVVEAVGEASVKIGEHWYELNSSRPGGIRVVEVI